MTESVSDEVSKSVYIVAILTCCEWLRFADQLNGLDRTGRRRRCIAYRIAQNS